MIHAPVDGIEEIRARRPFAAADVTRIDVGSNQHAVNEVGSIRMPKDMFGFQFSMNYALALQVVKGSNDFDAYIEENLKDPEIVSLAERIFTDTDEEVQSWFPETLGARVTIKFKDGSVEEALIRDCRGSPGNPMTAAELEAKARNIAGMSMAPDSFQAVIDAVRSLDTLADARVLGDLIRG